MDDDTFMASVVLGMSPKELEVFSLAMLECCNEVEYDNYED